MLITKLTTPTTLPRLRQAVADAGRFMAQRDDSERYSAAWREGNSAYEDSVWSAREAIRDELLPALCGGAWRMPGRQSWPRNPQLHGSVRALLDHVKTYRRPGCTGRPMWGNTVLASEAYLHPRGDLNSEGVQLAQRFAEHDCGVWHCPGLSSWFPGKTSLVIVARGIQGERADLAAELGFTKLA